MATTYLLYIEFANDPPRVAVSIRSTMRNIASTKKCAESTPKERSVPTFGQQSQSIERRGNHEQGH
jgi:hypothetical protein